MIPKLTPTQIIEFEIVLQACEELKTDRERQERIEGVADPIVRGLLALALAEPVSARNLRSGMRWDDYELVEWLGGGGFGEVWSAKQTGTQSASVAVKMVRNEHLRGDGTAAILKLFAEEIEHHRTLTHCGIVKLFRAGSLALPGGGIPIPYLVMELWSGLPLSDACRGRSAREKIQCFVRICEAVQHAHRHGLMHLDLKPENIPVKDQGGLLWPKVLDFGVARRFRPDRPFDSARFGAGTLLYKAPEQIEPSLGGEDFRTDVYALGVLLFQVLTDRLPYPVHNGTAEEYKNSILHGPRLSASAFVASVDNTLQEICSRAIEIDRSKRYDSPAQLAAALGQWLKRGRTLWRRRTVAVLLIAALAVAIRLVAHKQKPVGSWSPFPVHWAGENAEQSVHWRDICWRGDEGWLCGGVDEQSDAGRFVGHGILLHTLDGGKTWRELPRENFTLDSGTIHVFEDKKWNGVGPLSFIDIIERTTPDGLHTTNGWAAGVTGVYFSANAGSQDAKWVRVTPSPDKPDAYAFFGGLIGIDGYQEVYAYGWQGIAHWKEGEKWKVELKSHTFLIAGLSLVDRAHRDLWAVSNGGSLAPSQWGAFADHGALFHCAWPGTNWERIDLSGITIAPGQSLSQIGGTQKPTERLVVGSEGLILHGTFNGTKWAWKKAQTNTRQPLNAMNYDNNQGLWVVGGRGTVLTSTNGESWTEVPCFDESGSPIRSAFSQIRFFGRDGWIVGDNKVLKREGS